MDQVHVTVEFRWRSLGSVQIDSVGRLLFPNVPTVPGLYRFDLDDVAGSTTYIGETDQLARRLQHYRTPGPSQQTNLRLNEHFRNALSRGVLIKISIVTEAIDVRINEAAHQIDMSRKLDRVLLEHAALLAVRSGGHMILNAQRESTSDDRKP